MHKVKPIFIKITHFGAFAIMRNFFFFFKSVSYTISSNSLGKILENKLETNLTIKSKFSVYPLIKTKSNQAHLFLFTINADILDDNI